MLALIKDEKGETTMKWKVIVLSIGALAGCQQYPVNEQSVATRLYLGEQYLQAKQFAHATRNYRKVVALQPKNAQGWWGLAQIAAQQGDTATAHLYYQRAFQMAPENTRLRDNYGAFLCTLGQYDKARRVSKRDEKTMGNQKGEPRKNSSDVCLPES